MGPSADYSALTLQDPPTPIISNQSPHNYKEILLLDDGFDLDSSGGPIAMPSYPHHQQHELSVNDDDRRTTTAASQHPSPAVVVPRFSSPTEEPIIVQRSSLVQMNGQADDNNHNPKTGASLSPHPSTDKKNPPSASTLATEQEQNAWDLWFRIFSDLLRSGFSLDMMRDTLQQIFPETESI